ncbi:peptide chain release factor N(5)-glutamine methyltransferase [Erythrobacter sp.]|uniref:peptide chain release factor N(5)-glutamine methyltransferase n=1 Tax=Erythrobacter sp. TaxID=1042 RepID=UPI002E9B5AB6|nr:peptide chain release factor N(5)-glutamine methyltransferase [Erythrobacter sp.]
MKVSEALRSASDRLAETSDTARLDAELLMAHALGVTRSDMLLRHLDDHAPDGVAELVARRASHEPLAYIVGYQEFYGRGFKVTPGVLIPRSDSETLIETALAIAPNARRVLDLGTGSGALLVTLLLELPQAQGIGIDASAAAREVAEANAQAHGLIGAAARFYERDWTRPGWTRDLGRFDLVVCNPPYVEDGAALEPSVRDYEPAAALFAGEDGLDDYALLLPHLRSLLEEGGTALFEIGHRQGGAVSGLAREHGFSAEIRCDLADRPRCVIVAGEKREGGQNR